MSVTQAETMTEQYSERDHQHSFDKAIHLTETPEGFNSEVSKDYQNMVGPFGGVTAANIIQSVLQHPKCEGMPVSLTVNYLGPIANLAMSVRPVLLRTNRSNQHWRIELWQGEEVLVSATCVFAKRKETWSGRDIGAPKAEKFDAVAPMLVFPGMPAWVNQYDMRFINGNPFDGSSADTDKPSESLFWVSDKPKRKLDYASLTAIADSFFPRIMVSQRKIVPCGTVSLTVNFHVTDEELQSLDTCHLLGHARASKYSNGYFEQTAELWTPLGELAVTTSQTVYYKA